MKPRHLVLALALGASVLLAIWFSLLSSSEKTSASSIASLSTRPDDEPARVSLEERETLRSAAPSAEEATPEKPASGDIVLLGRCVDADAKPLPGVAFQLERWYPRADRRENEVLAPMHLRTDADGRFEISVPHVRVLTLHLSLLDARYAERQWRWQSLPPGSREDLGEITVARGATLRGRLLDFRGVPIREHWTVSLNAIQISERIAWVPSTSAEKSGTPSESFELVGLTAGKWKVTARYPTFEFATAVVELAAGEVRELELRQEGTRDPWREIVVRADVPDAMPRPESVHMRVVDSGGAARAAEPPESSTYNVRFVDLEPGFYRVEIADPRYKLWTQEHVEPSPRVVEAELEGNSAIEFLVLDASTGQPIESYGLELASHSRGGWGDEDLTKPRKQKPRPGGRTSFTGVAAGDLRFVLHAEGWPARHVDVKGLEPNETRSESIELHRGVALTGLVRRRGTAQPAPGSEVVLFRPALIGDGPESPLLRALWRTGGEEYHRKEVASTKTALDGSFRLEGVEPGRWILIAVALGPGERFPSWIFRCPSCAVREDVIVAVDTAPEPIVLELPAAGSISGRVSLPESARRERVALQLFRAIENKIPLVPPPYPMQNWDAALVGTTFPDPSGDYRFENLIAGRYRIAVAYSTDPHEPEALEERIALQRIVRNATELTLAEGADLRCDLDLSPFAPAEVRARLVVEGGELGKTTLTVRASLVPSAGPLLDWHLQQAPFDAQGTAVHSAVLPGRKLVYAIGGDGAWYHLFHRDLEVGGGTSHELSATVVLHAGEIEVESPAGRIVRTLVLRLHSEEPGLEMYAPAHSLRLDDRGRARLSLPAGRYALSSELRAGETTLTANFDWPAGDVVLVKLAAAR